VARQSQAHVALTELGGWGIFTDAARSDSLVLLARSGCGAERNGAIAWPVSILAINLVADLGNAVVRGDLRTLVGVPSAGR